MVATVATPSTDESQRLCGVSFFQRHSLGYKKLADLVGIGLTRKITAISMHVKLWDSVN